MATTYAAYSNAVHGMKAESQRNSVSSFQSGTATPQQHKKSSKWDRFIDQLKPLEEPQTPTGIYAPIKAKRMSTSSSASSQKELTTGQKVLKGYRKFQDIVVGPTYKVYM